MPDFPTEPQGVRHEKYQRLVKAAQGLSTIKVAVTHPCDDVSLGGAIEAARLGVIDLVLVGPEQRIRATAEDIGHHVLGP